jgi:hypothetical protein
MAVKGVTISDLNPIASPVVQLPGGLFEVEVLTGPVAGAYTSRRLTTEQLAAFLGAGLGPNASKSLLKEFRFFRKADRDADPNGGACFETDLDWSTCCAFTVCKIEFYRTSDAEPFRNQDLECVYDSAPTDPTHLAYIDGSFTGLRNPCKFVPVVQIDLSGILTTQQQHTQQLATLGAQGAPVMVYQRNGATVGYQTLDEALADTTQKVFMRFNTATVTATVSNNAAGWPYYVDGSGSTVFIADGVDLSLPGTSVDALLLSNFFFYFPAYAATGTGKVVLSSRPNTVITGQYAQLLNGYSEVPIQLNGATYEVINGYYASFTGTGTLHVYGNFRADSIATGITVVDHRGGAGAGTVKTVNGVAPDAAGEVTLASTDRYEVPQTVRDAVASGAFSSGELLGAAPAGSLAGQKFTTATYGYEYERGVGGGLVWCRYAKG